MSDPTIFHSEGWKRVLIETFGYKPFYYGSLSDKAFLPAMLVKSPLLGKKFLCSSPFGEAEPIVSGCGDLAGMFEFLDKIFSEEKLDYIEIKGMGEDCIGTAKKFGFRETYENFRFAIDLKDPLDAIFNNFKGTIKYDIKRAGSLGLIVKKEIAVDDFYRLHLRTMKRLGTPPLGKDFFANMFKYLGENAVMFSAFLDGKRISSIILLIDPNKNESRYAFASNDRKYKNINANTLLIYEAIKYSKQIGCKYFDFGVSRQGSGVWEFKKKWCPAEPARVHYMYKFRTQGVIDVRDKKIRLFAKIWRNFIPLFVANMIGPFIRRQLGK